MLNPVRSSPPSVHPRVAIAAAVMAPWLLTGCSARSASVPPAPAVVAYTVRAVTPGGEVLRYPVEVAPRYSNALSFRVGGQILERRVRLGDSVAAGQVLARLDPADAERQEASARAALAAAQHRLAYARQQLDRDRAQFARQLIASNQLEATEDAYASAEAARDQAADQAVVAQNALTYCALRAEHAGVIVSENADTGQVVTAGQPVYQLAWSGDLDAVLDADARDAGRLSPGQVATLSFPTVGAQTFAARVREIAPAADTQSRTFHVKLTLVSPGPSLRLGMIGEATLSPTAAQRAPGTYGGAEIPATALFHSGASPAVWVIAGASPHLELRRVSVQRYLERSVQVAGGLDPGERIVAAGVHTVFAGERVTPVGPLYPAEDGATGDAGAAR